MAAEQRVGLVRPDIDPVMVVTGLVAITPSLLLSTLRVGDRNSGADAAEIAAVLEATIDEHGTNPTRPAGPTT